MSIAPVPVMSAASRPALLVALGELAAKATAIDVDSGDGDRGATEHASSALRRMLEHTLELLAALQGVDDSAITELDAVEPDAWLGPQLLAGAIPRVGDVCFAGGLELKRVLRELIAAHDDDARLVAAETSRRKLRRAIRAVLEVAHAAGVHDVFGVDPHVAHQIADLVSALAIRRLYAKFRRALRRAADDTPDAVLSAVRYAGGALATLVAEPDYADVRASDRTVLRRLRERALQWARHDRSVPAGLHLLEDVWTYSDLLRGINRRQELKDHDGPLIAVLLRGPDDEVAAWFARLDALFGLDDALDHLLERARAMTRDRGALDPLVPEALVHLAQVQ